jgi:hypothetical protein
MRRFKQHARITIRAMKDDELMDYYDYCHSFNGQHLITGGQTRALSVQEFVRSEILSRMKGEKK